MFVLDTIFVSTDTNEGENERNTMLITSSLSNLLYS